MTKTLCYCLFFIIGISVASFGQQREIDSLKTALYWSKEDTGRVVILYNLAAKFIRMSPDSTFNYLNKTVEAYNKVLSASEKNSQYNSNQKEQIRSTINRIKARSALTRGAAFVIIAKLPEGLKFSLEAVKLFSTLTANTDNLSGLASALKNTGIIFFKLEDHDKALEYYGKAQDVAKKIGDKKMIANISDNIQSVYLSIVDNEPDRKKAEKLYRTALANYLETEKIYTELNDPILIGMTNGSIGFVYIALKDYAHALPYLQKSAQIHEEMGDNISLAYDRSQLAVVQTALKNYSSAENYLNLALASNEEDGSIEATKDLELIYYLLDSSRGHFQDAIEHYKNYISASDSINNVDNAKKQTRLEMQFNFDRKEADAKAEQEKKDIRQRNIRYSITFGLIGALIFLGVVYRQRNRIKKEKHRSEELLLNILPEEVAEELKAKGEAEAKQMDEVTVLFTDFKGFTQLSEKLTPKELVAEIHECFSAFDAISQKYGVEKIKTIGDAYMAAGGLPVPNNTHAEDVVNAALEIQQFMQQHKEEREAQGKLFFEIRIGIHTGPVVAGIVGVKKFAYDIWGDTVNTASRMESSGESGKINISETTYALVKDKFSCIHRGKISAKGKGEIDMYFINGIKCLVFLLFFFSIKVHATEPDLKKIDSLQTLLIGSLHDTTRANIYFHIADEYWNYVEDQTRQKHNFNLSRQYANMCLQLSEKCDYTRGIGDAYYVLAGLSEDEGKSMEAIDLKKKALTYYKMLGDNKKLGKCFYALGLSFNNVGDLEQALHYYFEGISYYEKLKDSSEIAGIYHNVGMLYNFSDNHTEAINYTIKALRINEKREAAKPWLGLNCLNLGNYLSDDGAIYNEEALKYFQRARDVFRSLDQKKEMGMALVGYGSMVAQSGRFSEGIDTLSKTLSLFRKINDINGIAWTYNILGWNYTRHHLFKQASVCLDSCLRLCKSLGPGAIKNAYQRLYQLDSTSGNLKLAFVHYRAYIHLRDSLNTTNNIQLLAKQQLRTEYAKKEEREKIEQEKKEALQKIIRNSILLGMIGSFAFLFVVYRQRNRIKTVNNKNEELLLNILPEEVADELKAKGAAEAKQMDEVTVLFTDFKGFTQLSEKLTPKELVAEIHECFSAFDAIMQKYGVEKIKTIGDAYMAAGGLPVPNNTHAEDVVNAALEIQQFMQQHKEEREAQGKLFFEIRIGIHTGPVVAGIVGVKKFAYDIWGDTVNTASRMESSGEAGKINISETTYALVKDKFSCTHRGKISAKGKGEIDMYFVVS